MEFEENIRVGLNGLVEHKFRSFLTMLGIIFGVASVIAMLSIGEGAKREAIAKYQELGEVRAKFSQGLSLEDAEVIKNIVPGVSKVASQAELETEVKYSDKSSK